MKLEYFKELGWPTDWIDTAEAITRRVFERDYAHLPGPDGPSLPSTLTAPPRVPGNMFASLPYPKTGRAAISELDEYLATKTVKTDNPLQHWHLRRLDSPRLSRFARDYLSVPRESLPSSAPYLY